MTDDEINASIAEACGWTEVNATHRSGRAPGASYVGSEFIPNYCEDHNAMHIAQLRLTPDEFVDYTWNIMHECHEPMLSSARQRAEAFLRTLRKWKE
jgi:hypothetical protein